MSFPKPNNRLVPLPPLTGEELAQLDQPPTPAERARMVAKWRARLRWARLAGLLQARATDHG